MPWSEDVASCASSSLPVADGRGVVSPSRLVHIPRSRPRTPALAVSCGAECQSRVAQMYSGIELFERSSGQDRNRGREHRVPLDDAARNEPTWKAKAACDLAEVPSLQTGGAEAADQPAHAASNQTIRPNALTLQHLQDADVCQASSRSTPEREREPRPERTGGATNGLDFSHLVHRCPLTASSPGRDGLVPQLARPRSPRRPKDWRRTAGNARLARTGRCRSPVSSRRRGTTTNRPSVCAAPLPPAAIRLVHDTRP